MRRGLSIFMVLLFGLGPLAATLEASDQSRLPACCRRHGAHHCTMSPGAMGRMAEQSPTGAPSLTAASHCPCFPGYTAAPTAPGHALAAASTALPVLLSQPHSPASTRGAALLSQILTRAGRGPPATSLA